MNFITDYTIYFDEMHNHKFDLYDGCLRISYVNYSLMEMNTFCIEHMNNSCGKSYLVGRWSEDCFVTTYRSYIYFKDALEACGIKSLDIDTTDLLEMWEAKVLAFTMVGEIA